MRNIVTKILILLIGAGVCTLSGCPALVAGGAAVTAGTGTYMFINGELKTDYHFPFDRVWNACEKTVAEMNAVDVIPLKEIGSGTIDAIINQEKVRFNVTYKSKDLTTVGIRIGLLGNQLASQRLHDKISEILLQR
ncbi:MAG TPA: DUF3568 domain-containing protein [Deltaproteobacteria bacterium]|jgi:hypothetical protein|nr:DUF3568 domain-containing protein [Deltaproteobacteria bacterium]